MARKQLPKRSDAEWYSVITECRKSGLCDSEWCIQHNIPPSTFFCALKRLRNKAYAIPESTKASDNYLDLTSKQDVVRIDITEELVVPDTVTEIAQLNTPVTSNLDNSHTIEISLGAASIKLNNNADPVLLKQVLLCIGGSLC